MTLQSKTLRPGLLVSLKTSLRGNIEYRKTEIEPDHTTEEGKRQARWETKRVIADPAEYEAAAKARSKASSIVRGVCSLSAFGLLCPEGNKDVLEKAIKDARKVIDDFNDASSLTRIFLYIMAGRIAPDDVEAVKAINSEVSDLMQQMQEGIKELDVKKVREAASRAKQIGNMLTPDAEARITVAIDAARSAARKIVQAGEQAAGEIDLVAVRKITEARTAFLDDGPVNAVKTPRAVGRAVDLLPLERSE
jgi:hypothetical protein